MAKFYLIIPLLVLSVTLTAQERAYGTENSDRSKKEQSEKNLYSYYATLTDSTYALINGREFINYYIWSKQKPILFSGKNHTASITINSIKYCNVIIDYDTYLDEVIYIDSSRFFTSYPLKILLNRQTTDSFELCFENDTLLFVYFTADNDTTFTLPDGFYEMAFQGKSRYLIKHRSIIQSRKGYKDYLYKPVTYIDVGNGFVKISGRSHFTGLFGDKYPEIKLFMKKSGIKPGHAEKKDIIRILKYYDSL